MAVMLEQEALGQSEPVLLWVPVRQWLVGVMVIGPLIVWGCWPYFPRG